MVGKNSSIRNKKTFAEITAGFIGRPFRKGGRSKESGFDCVGFIYNFTLTRGKYFPDALGDIDLQNYPDFYTNHSDKIENALNDLFDSFGTEVTIGGKLPGDIMIVRHKNGNVFPAVYAGNGNGIASFLNVGVRLFPLDDKAYPIRIRRPE
jgi:cell wall-associated NlpC family hydrolase